MPGANLLTLYRTVSHGVPLRRWRGSGLNYRPTEQIYTTVDCTPGPVLHVTAVSLCRGVHGAVALQLCEKTNRCRGTLVSSLISTSQAR